MAERVRRLVVTVTLQSPLALSGHRLGSAETLDYLPGARLRGAVAELLLDEGVCPPAHRAAHAHCATGDCPIGALFGGPAPAIFRDALPAPATDVLPATAVSCKHAPGFRPAAGGPRTPAEPRHGVFDTLLDRAAWEILAPAGLVYTPTCPTPTCGASVERQPGAYARRAVGGGLHYVEARVTTRLLARTAVDRQRQASAEDLRYSVPVVSEGVRDAADRVQPTAFRGEVLAPDDAHGALLADALARVEHLGGGTSRGLGAVRVAVSEAPAADSLAARLDGFARAVALRRTQYASLAPLSAASLEGSYFSLDLRSDALLRRGGWEPTTVVDADLLRATTGMADPSLSLVRAYAEPGWRGGWHAAWGLPRPAELVVRRGSCYLFRTSNLAGWTPALEALEAGGLGARTAEGFGEVRVCDPFHLVLRERAA